MPLTTGDGAAPAKALLPAKGRLSVSNASEQAANFCAQGLEGAGALGGVCAVVASASVRAKRRREDPLSRRSALKASRRVSSLLFAAWLWLAAELVRAIAACAASSSGVNFSSTSTARIQKRDWP